MTKYTIINDHNELISDELDRIGTVADESKKLECIDTCFKLNKIFKNFDKLESYLDKAIREIENKEKFERGRE